MLYIKGVGIACFVKVHSSGSAVKTMSVELSKDGFIKIGFRETIGRILCLQKNK